MDSQSHKRPLRARLVEVLCGSERDVTGAQTRIIAGPRQPSHSLAMFTGSLTLERSLPPPAFTDCARIPTEEAM